MPTLSDISTSVFQSTLPTRGSDLHSQFFSLIYWQFQSTLPTRGSDGTSNVFNCQPFPFQSTLPTRGSDGFNGCTSAFNVISIHAPHEGERPHFRGDSGGDDIFQSTLPTRGSDTPCSMPRPKIVYFNPRSPRGGATVIVVAYLSTILISIHAPHEGERRAYIRLCTARHNFNPRSPRGGATCSRAALYAMGHISIHAPHEGERLRGRCRWGKYKEFQSTLPTRGSDTGLTAISAELAYFNPRSPRGGATRD